ncbi:uncharacterized protein MYCFIDRAFT_171467 [Pseudocercospora fijiensis CIRAD86]|uniref:Uncharacterized protein n=1 Tax=Pseudocercospora fijiensis (strain CIRAD86) TaxID=383855 RepID=M3ALT5_PSEFD|nr:uncharacterized protein MYCFIDRAFT_171467 [Pseudocercospora fijiensis CIRAD86]EME85561.1 hypothetical protein MYCFIDRAFT_171467 [Pseudocercospora fijiensis CIRAD86]
MDRDGRNLAFGFQLRRDASRRLCILRENSSPSLDQSPTLPPVLRSAVRQWQRRRAIVVVLRESHVTYLGVAHSTLRQVTHRDKATPNTNEGSTLIPDDTHESFLGRSTQSAFRSRKDSLRSGNLCSLTSTPTYTLFGKMNARLDMPLYNLHIPDLEMGQKQNRKRTRHRPSRSKRQSSVYGMSKADQSATTSPKHMWSTSCINTYWQAPYVTPLQRPQLLRKESATSRDRRMFGGEDDDTKSAMDLRGPMLDVVLGLFNGIDYDDALRWSLLLPLIMTLRHHPQYALVTTWICVRSALGLEHDFYGTTWMPATATTI